MLISFKKMNLIDHNFDFFLILVYIIKEKPDLQLDNKYVDDKIICVTLVMLIFYDTLI